MKFEIRIKNLYLSYDGGEKKTFKGDAILNSLINAHQKLGDNLYQVNVRGQLFKNNCRSNRVYKSISDTIIDIHNAQMNNNPKLDHEFDNQNNGCLLIVSSIRHKKEDIYEVSIDHPYEGIGNGQQSISASSITTTKYPISDNVSMGIKVMVGYPETEARKACEKNNTSNKIGVHDISSNYWLPLSNQLIKKGYDLRFKNQHDKSTGDKIINLWSQGFRNFLSSYHTDKPWIKASDVDELLVPEEVSTTEIIEVHRIWGEIKKWKSTKFQDEKVDRSGYYMDTIAFLYKKYFSPELFRLESDFFEMAFNAITDSVEDYRDLTKSDKKTWRLIDTTINLYKERLVTANLQDKPKKLLTSI